MGHHSTLTRSLALALIATALTIARAQTISPVSAVTAFNADRIRGTWYEIARYPYNKEKHCVSDARELIAPDYKPTQLLLVDACVTKAGDTEARNLTAVAKKKSTGGEFKVRTFWPFWRKYWILALSPDYSWTMLGSPDHKTLWIFSKSPTLAPDLLAEIEAKAAAEGFPANRLVMTPQIHP
jgi:apolipoprotein D and lipocalin family protein